VRVGGIAGRERNGTTSRVGSGASSFPLRAMRTPTCLTVTARAMACQPKVARWQASEVGGGAGVATGPGRPSGRVKPTTGTAVGGYPKAGETGSAYARERERNFAQRAFCASEIRFLPAADNCRRRRPGRTDAGAAAAAGSGSDWGCSAGAGEAGGRPRRRPAVLSPRNSGKAPRMPSISSRSCHSLMSAPITAHLRISALFATATPILSDRF